MWAALKYQVGEALLKYNGPTRCLLQSNHRSRIFVF